MNTANELAKLGGCLREVGDRLVHHGRCHFEILWQLRLHRPKQQGERHEALLGAVVEVAPDLAACLVLDGDDPRAAL